ncbi:putative anucleate primary sterigmata protein A [Rosellinia necatrix]|uniref:Putative anucleate primary sterigmata protein A n=1 Tax=Rosellinia necatrix TaxID=77044 RepID=A0A1W2TF14_ROSNE|nr:putative anucleate primary sterigmata protein A [Rosellinia necatrix]
MATTPPLPDDLSVTVVAPALDVQNDPFRSAGPTQHRFSHFNAKLFALGPNASPAQAKRALEAHLAETERRMEEAGKLGTALVQQRTELTERLKEVEKLQAEGELSEDLRQRLVDIEREYNEVARDSARAFLPKSRVPSNEAAAGSPFVPEAKGGKRSVSPSKFEAQATGSPTKPTVTNRKIRNQPSNRIHDIEFAAEISTSLIAQVRSLQGLLAEKEEELRDVRADNSKLEYEAEGFQQRLKTLDDSEQRYKDENWNLETQIHELMAKEKEGADREKKLTQTLNILQSEKNAGQRELDEIKLSYSKLTEEHAAAVKHHDIELGTAKRTMVMGESERVTMQKKIEELTGQNTELAKAVSVSMRGRKLERESIIRTSDDDLQGARDNSTPEQSPPPSPIKGTPRHSMLESETLKTSLAHAQRTIQSLRTNVHREKTEKMETRRLLQEARDEIEKLRSEPVVPHRRARKAESKEFKKPPRLLGGLRSARSEIFLEDPDWEDQPEVLPHPMSSPVTRESTMVFRPVPEHSDHFETANETSDAAFETANENGMETEAFHTGAEEFSSDDALTETESPSKRRTLTTRPNLFNVQRSASIDSTASTEDEDFPYDHMRTPPSLPPPSKFPLRVSRGAYRRSRHASEEAPFLSSPPSFVSSSNVSTPQQGAQNLAAELGDFDDSGDESTMSATPSRRSIRGRAMTPPPALPPLPRVLMVDSGMMTEPLDELAGSSRGVGIDRPISMNTVVSRFSMGSDYSDAGTQYLGEKLAQFPSPPTNNAALTPQLALSTVHSHDLEPLVEPDTHVQEMLALRKDHAEQLNNLSIENASAHAAAVGVLELRHVEELTAAKNAYTQELETLRSGHGDAIQKAVADVKAAHTLEIESIKTRHADEIRQVIADAHNSHIQELDSIKALHIQQLAERETESQASYSADMEALKNAHAEELSQQQLEHAAAHAAGLEALKTSHAELLDRIEHEKGVAHNAEVETLKADHAKDLSKKESEMKEAAFAELDVLKTKHTKELASFKAESEATHAAELVALVEAEVAKTEVLKRALCETHAKELDGLKSNHVVQIDEVKQTMGVAHSEQLESLRAMHLQQIDDTKTSVDAAHKEEMEALRAIQAQRLVEAQDELITAHAAAIASLTDSHSKELTETKMSLQNTHSQELQSLKALHARQVEDLVRENDVTHSAAVAAMVSSHREQMDEIKSSMGAAHVRELEHLKASHVTQLEELVKEKDAAHAIALTSMVGSHTKQLEAQKTEAEATVSREIAALKAAHAQEIELLNSQHATAHAKELEGFKAAIAKQVESSKTEGDAAHGQQIDALNAAHAEIIEAHKRDAEIAQSHALEAMKSSHERQIDTLNAEHTATKTREVELVTTKHLDELEGLRVEYAAASTKELRDLADKHLRELTSLKHEHEVLTSQLRKDLAVAHSQELEDVHQTITATQSKELEALRQELNDARSKDIESLRSKHVADLEAFRIEHESITAQRLKELEDSHSRQIAEHLQDSEQAKSKELAVLSASHAEILNVLKVDHQSEMTQKIQELTESHSRAHQAALDQALGALREEHLGALETIKTERDTRQSDALNALKFEHSQQLDLLKTEAEAKLARELEALKADHVQARELQTQQGEASLLQELDTLRAQHAQALESQISESDAILVRELDALKARHARILESHIQESTSEKEQLHTVHAAELEALRASLTVARPVLAYSPVSSVQTEPIELPEIKSPRREAFIIPQDREPMTPRAHNKRSKNISIPIIAEDDTRQSPSAIIRSDTPDSQRPFKEITGNTDVRLLRKPAATTTHQSSQTTLTGEGLDRLARTQGAETGTQFDESNAATPSTIRRRLSSDSLGNVTRGRHRIAEPSGAILPDPFSTRRPDSSASVRSSILPRPPLPPNHREVIEAARTNSAQGGKGTMPPPLLAASAYRPSSSGPRTPGNVPPQSPASVARGALTPRAGRTPGYADVHSSMKMPMRSRQSSISSFASEIDTRFNIQNGMGMDPGGFGPSTDPRMIQAVTQTMIGEYLWKYTRKTGRGEMSENRHRRFFWVHPYTRALYWSDGDPGAGGRGEMRAKSVPIEAVRVVADDNPMPPGLHRKSLIVIAPGRTVKFTCQTGQRHETWFNALSYLLLRSGNESRQDNEEVAGSITQEDVDEFNPSTQRQSTSAQRPRPPPSLSSYNSRTTRNESPSLELTMNIPTLTPTHEKESARNGTFGRLSGYWKSSSLGRSTMNSLRSRSYQPYDSAIYEASEVPDSAEDVRQIIEQQDRESDRLENVRACCDGKHDVSTLPYTSKRGRLPNFNSQSHLHTHPGPSGSQSAVGSMRSRS